jgi:hypothetical protein
MGARFAAARKFLTTTAVRAVTGGFTNALLIAEKKDIALAIVRLPDAENHPTDAPPMSNLASWRKGFVYLEAPSTAAECVLRLNAKLAWKTR